MQVSSLLSLSPAQLHNFEGSGNLQTAVDAFHFVGAQFTMGAQVVLLVDHSWHERHQFFSTLRVLVWLARLEVDVDSSVNPLLCAAEVAFAQVATVVFALDAHRHLSRTVVGHLKNYKINKIALVIFK